MKVIKRNGAEVEFDIVKIIAAVTKANAATYNLAGQRVGKDYEGIVICNGKKFKK